MDEKLSPEQVMVRKQFVQEKADRCEKLIRVKLFEQVKAGAKCVRFYLRECRKEFFDQDVQDELEKRFNAQGLNVWMRVNPLDYFERILMFCSLDFNCVATFVVRFGVRERRVWG